MGRPPCCDKVGIKKGPWTPEEDIILVSYIQEHGPGNWRSVPTNTGLLRCSKSCRLRWTNYLRPGIKRGNFTPHEEGMIIHLQALLGNKWAAIASYLPQRTDNDIKNYWNTHLKKKLKKFQTALDPHNMASSADHHLVSKSKSTNSDLFSAAPGTNQPAATYASSTENISRLLEAWMGSSPNKTAAAEHTSSHHFYRPKAEQEGGEFIPHEEFDSMLSFENLNNVAWDKSTCDSGSENVGNEEDKEVEKQHAPPMADSEMPRKQRVSAADSSGAPQLSVFEKWLLDESTGHVVEEMMELSPIF